MLEIIDWERELRIKFMLECTPDSVYVKKSFVLEEYRRGQLKKNMVKVTYNLSGIYGI